MYHRLSSIMFPIVSLLLIGSVYWGYQEHQEKNSILIKAENNYQRAFHDLTNHVDKLHQQLGNTLAVNSTSQGFHRKGLVNVWRLTSQAQNEISQLPLSFLPFNEAEEFLSRISNFAYKTAVRDLTKQPLTPEEFTTMKTLHAKSAEIATDLRKMQKDVLANKLRWMDVEIAISAAQSKSGNVIVDGLKSVDKKVGAYPELDWGPSVNSMYQKRTFKTLSGNMVSADEIKHKAASFLKTDPAAIHVVENAPGTEYASYTASASSQDQNHSVQMDYTRKGGQLVSFMKSREIGQKQITPDKAKAIADSFLEEHGFKNMKAVNYDESANTSTITYVGMQNGVLVYPNKLSVKVALDNGEPVGLRASDYVHENHKREMPSPIMTKEEARKALNPEMKVHGEQLAIIDGDMGEEVLCYEYTGKINGGTYRIYINANNGLEESIELMSGEEERAGVNK